MIYIKILGNRVHLLPLKPSLTTDSGICLVEKYIDDNRQFKVLGVGPGRKLKDGNILPVEVQPGQRVLIPWIADSIELSDGSIIVAADQIWAAWETEQ